VTFTSDRFGSRTVGSAEWVVVAALFNWTGLIVVGVFLLIILGVALGYYTRTGSEIGEHPVDERGGSPGGRGPATVSGAGRMSDDGFSSRGTR
jgi:hypothetical protein